MKTNDKDIEGSHCPPPTVSGQIEHVVSSESFEAHEFDVPPELMDQQVQVSRLYVENAKLALEKAKKDLWHYEHSSFYSKSLRRAREQGYSC
jgi:hypothetical protein